MTISRRRFLALTTAGVGVSVVGAPAVFAATGSSKKIQIGIIAPMSGLFSQYGTQVFQGAQMAVADINGTGGIKSLGGAQLELVKVDTSDSTEKSKSAAQRMVATYPGMVAAIGSYLSSFTLAVTEVTERAKLPVLTLSYSDQITDRGYAYVFQTSAPASMQMKLGMPMIFHMATQAGAAKPKRAAILTDNTASPLAVIKALKEGGILKENGIELVYEEVFTPPLSDASLMIQKLRRSRPDLLFLLPTSVPDIRLCLEKMNEMGVKVPVVANGTSIVQPEILGSIKPAVLDGVIAIVGGWVKKGDVDLAARYCKEFDQPFMTQNPLTGYGHVDIVRQALEKYKARDREALGKALHELDGGPAKYFPGGLVKFTKAGRRVDASVNVAQWQSGVPVTVAPTDQATAKPIWKV